MSDGVPGPDGLATGLPADLPDDAALTELGVYDPSRDHPDRAELVRVCLVHGATLEEIALADDLAELAIDHLFRPGSESLTLSEVAARAGLERDAVREVLRAAGLVVADDAERAYSEHDVDAMAAFAVVSRVFGHESMLRLVRVAGTSLARVADAGISAFVRRVAPVAGPDDPARLHLVLANAEVAAYLPRVVDALGTIFRRHLVAERRPIAGTPTTDYESRDLAIGFADLVGSSALAEQLDLAELTATFERFEDVVADTIQEHGGRVVKFIGDEVMYRATDPATACRIAATLVRGSAAGHELPPLRVGVAAGEVLTREGDCFGPIVNVAARVTKLAPEGGVVVTADVAAAVAGVLASEPLGPVSLRGFDAPVELARLAVRA